MSDSSVLSRRKLVFGAGSALSVFALSRLSVGCKAANRGGSVRDAVGADVGAAKAPNYGDISTWLEQVSPIARLENAKQTEFSGDEPIMGHPVFRDGESIPGASKTPDEEFDVVVIGGGISGLATAYRLIEDWKALHASKDIYKRRYKASEKLRNDRYKDGLKICVLEHASRFGGNSKGETWNNISFSLGAAYLVNAEPGEAVFDNFYGPLGLDKLWRKSNGDPVELNGQIKFDFWDGHTLDEDDELGRKLFRQAHQDLKQLANLKSGEVDRFKQVFPNLPVPDDDPDLWRQIEALDEQSLFELMSTRYPYKNTGAMHPQMRALIEHFCWSSFGGSSTEISAAAGLNFLAGEFIGIVGLPGGNSHVAKRLVEELARDIGQDNMRTNALVTKVANEDGGVTVEYVHGREGGAVHRIKAQAAVMACPKFIAAKILKGIPAPHTTLIRQMEWRAYMVASALYNEPTSEGKNLDFLDLYLLGDGQSAVGAVERGGNKLPSPDALAKVIEKEALAVKATDLLQSHWSQKNPELAAPLKLAGADLKNSVLTFYRAFPVKGSEMRKRLIPYPSKGMDKAAYAQQEAALLATYKAEFTEQINAIVPKTIGLTTKPVEVRVSRWGHPLCLARKGLFNRRTVQQFQNGVGKVFYCNQDNWSLPAIETALTEALTTSNKVLNSLGLIEPVSEREPG